MANEDQPVASAAGEGATYEVKLLKRFEYMEFMYRPGHEHVVNQEIKDAMTAAGAVASVKQLS